MKAKRAWGCPRHGNVEDWLLALSSCVYDGNSARWALQCAEELRRLLPVNTIDIDLMIDGLSLAVVGAECNLPNDIDCAERIRDGLEAAFSLASADSARIASTIRTLAQPYAEVVAYLGLDG